MQIPFVDLKSQYNSIKKEIDQAISNVIESSAFIGGTYVKEFENNFAKYINAKHCIGVANGTEALYITLKSLGISKNDEVITVANTFIATSEAITMTGATVVFVDCNPDYYNINTNKIEQAITNQTKAIIPVHLYGQSAEMTKIVNIAKKYNLNVIEDAAQAHGAEYNQSKIGTLGIASCFSFFPGKNLGAYGDAGAIVTNNTELAKTVRMFANHGRMQKYNHKFEGFNSRLDGLQAAILDVKLKYLDQWIKRRRTIADIYNNNLKNIITPTVISNAKHAYHLYVIRIKDRNKLQKFLKEKGISTGIHYPIPLPFLNAYKYLKHIPEDFPVAYKLKDEILSLPIYGNMSNNQVDYILTNIKKFYN